MYHVTFSGPAGGVLDRKHKELRAIREIKKGEEVTISYLGFQLLLRDKEYRQRKLFDSWEFRCSCSQCRETRRAEEEGRLLADIRKLMKSKLRASVLLGCGSSRGNCGAGPEADLCLPADASVCEGSR